MKENIPHVTCFGEVLWDMLPAGKKAGGAPMNVAYHLKRLGLSSSLISRVGNDPNGRELLSALQALGVETAFIQSDREHPTSTVEVEIGADNEVSYDIVYPVAWDHIEYQASFAELLGRSDAIVFGSLSGRNEISRQTLLNLLDIPSFKAFDVNLRPPFYDESYISALLERTNLLKLNLAELHLLASWHGNASDDEAAKVRTLQKKFKIKEVIVTRGGSGASFYTEDQQYHQPAYRIEVKDTVGSGDSFLAAFLSKRLQNKSAGEMLDFASAVAAFVTTKDGACPEYTKEDIKDFLQEKR